MGTSFLPDRIRRITRECCFKRVLHVAGHSNQYGHPSSGSCDGWLSLYLGSKPLDFGTRKERGFDFRIGPGMLPYSLRCPDPALCWRLSVHLQNGFVSWDLLGEVLGKRCHANRQGPIRTARREQDTACIYMPTSVKDSPSHAIALAFLPWMSFFMTQLKLTDSRSPRQEGIQRPAFNMLPRTTEEYTGPPALRVPKCHRIKSTLGPSWIERLSGHLPLWS
ncbi:hypothetical protein F5Y18DRAFT_345509 [Xylariaceae sp. FL1019]|nr:hypothetical protein F5Y18DRAFT_345509 [Xylariaceae sp. FL1019]